MKSSKRKVVIIGNGFVGSTTAYTLLLESKTEEVVIIDINKDKVIGDVLDMQQGMPLLETPKSIKVGEYSDIKDAKVIIITAGVGQKDPNESRIDLLNRNLRVFDSIIANIKPYLSKAAIVLVVSNPVDILAYYTYRKLEIEPRRVIGSGTVLDTQRLRFLLSEITGIDPRNVHSYVVGEHGDSEVMAFSASNIGGIPFKEFCGSRGTVCKRITNKTLSEIGNKVRYAAHDIIGRKGATYYAVALAVRKIVDVILGDQNSILKVSTLMTNEFEGRVHDLYFSLPCLLGAQGAQGLLHPNYNKKEKDAIIASAEVLKNLIKELDF